MEVNALTCYYATWSVSGSKIKLLVQNKIPHIVKNSRQHFQHVRKIVLGSVIVELIHLAHLTEDKGQQKKPKYLIPHWLKYITHTNNWHYLKKTLGSPKKNSQYVTSPWNIFQLSWSQRSYRRNSLEQCLPYYLIRTL